MEVLEHAPPTVQTDLMPDQATSAQAMAVAAFIAVVKGLLNPA